MRKEVIALSLTTAAFAASTLYFARELDHERAERAQQPQISVASIPAPAPIAESPATPTMEPSSSAAMTATLAKAPTSARSTELHLQDDGEARAKISMRKYNQEFVDRMADPEKRLEMLAEFKANMRSQYPRLAQSLGLSDADGERLLDLLALQTLERQANSARCGLDPQCSIRTWVLDTANSPDRDIEKLLGVEGRKKFNQYQQSLSERASVTQFRSRLSDANYLQEDSAEALIKVLADERMRIMLESPRSGMSGIGNGTGMVFISGDAKTPEARLASAEEYSRRIRARAAEVLTAEQARVFDQMQEEVLTSSRSQIRNLQTFSSDQATGDAMSAVIINQ